MRVHLVSWVVLTTALLAGCEVRTDRWLERQAEVDPPELWQVEVVGAEARPVQVCVDTLLREGFGSPLPEVGGQPCVLIREPVEHEGGRIGRCASAGRPLLFSVNREGDPAIHPVGSLPAQLGHRRQHRSGGTEAEQPVAAGLGRVVLLGPRALPVTSSRRIPGSCRMRP